MHFSFLLEWETDRTMRFLRGGGVSVSCIQMSDQECDQKNQRNQQLHLRRFNKTGARLYELVSAL